MCRIKTPIYINISIAQQQNDIASTRSAIAQAVVLECLYRPALSVHPQGSERSESYIHGLGEES